MTLSSTLSEQLPEKAFQLWFERLPSKHFWLRRSRQPPDKKETGQPALLGKVSGLACSTEMQNSKVVTPETRKRALEKFSSALGTFKQGSTVENWIVTEKAYAHFRKTFIGDFERGNVSSVAAWTARVEQFRNRFYGQETPDAVVALLKSYWKLWDKWHQKTPAFKTRRAKRAKKLGLNKTEKAKAAKAAWRAANPSYAKEYYAAHPEKFKRKPKPEPKVKPPNVQHLCRTLEAASKSSKPMTEAQLACGGEAPAGRWLCDACLAGTRAKFLRGRRAA